MIPDYETAVDPFTVEQTKAVVLLLIDTYYGDEQDEYRESDLAHWHSILSQTVEEAVALSREGERHV